MTTLSIGGGSFKGISFVGALEYLHSRNYLTLLNEFHGTSIGSVIGILYIIGYLPFEIFKWVYETDMKDISRIDLNNLFTEYSIIDDNFFNKVNDIFSKKEDINITIKDFISKYGIDINIYVVSIKYRKLINVNSEDYNNMRVVDAIKASASIPILFKPFKYGDDYLIDGCCKNLDGITKINNNGYTIRFDYSKYEINNFNQYLGQLFNLFLQSSDGVKNNINTLNITLPSEYKNKYNFNDIKNTDKVALYYNGLVQARDFYK